VEDAAPGGTQLGEFGGNFTINGIGDENAVVWGDDPFNNKALLWKCILNTSASDGDGGWNKSIVIPANNNIGYLSYVYFKADFTADNANDGTVYLGAGQTTGQTLNLDGTNNTNPYSTSSALNAANNGGAVIANRWYIMVGIYQAYNNSTTDNDTIAGVYDVETGEKVATGGEFKMGNNTTGQVHIAYVYYDASTDANENVYFWNPGFHAIDGSEPKIQDLVKRQVYLDDNVKAAFGTGNDLEIYHDRFKGYIKNITGALNIESNNIEIGTYNNSATGLRSIAIGANTTASNTDAIAMGENTTATGISSTAIGKATNASADGATSMGNGTTASGVNSTSMGVNTLASGSHSTATGNGTVASGTNSISAGSSTTAGGNQSFAVGFSSTANGNVATAMGNSTVASGTSATAMGLYSVASGVAATATGYDTEASGANSTAMGKETTASGENSFATGQGPTASGDNSTALGRSTFSTGTNSFAAGLLSRASGEDSTAMGANSVASGNKSVSIGDRTIANSFSEIAIGSNPVAKTGNATTWIATDRLFSIGNGASASSQSMALEILKNGITVLPAVVSLSFADDTAAATGGVPVGGLYHTSGAIKIRLA
jgi:hypothetical protein